MLEPLHVQRGAHLTPFTRFNGKDSHETDPLPRVLTPGQKRELLGIYELSKKGPVKGFMVKDARRTVDNLFVMGLSSPWYSDFDEIVLTPEGRKLAESYIAKGPAEEIEAKPGKDFMIPKWEPKLGDEVVFAGQYATGMEFPQGVIHRRGYKSHGDVGIVVGWIGNQLVVRGGDEYDPATGHVRYENAAPGEGYRDFWAPANEFYLIKHGTNIEAPHVSLPGLGLFASRAPNLEAILQAWAKSRGLPPIPKFDLETFIKDNPFIEEPTKEQERELRRDYQRRQRQGR